MTENTRRSTSFKSTYSSRPPVIRGRMARDWEIDVVRENNIYATNGFLLSVELQEGPRISHQ